MNMPTRIVKEYVVSDQEFSKQIEKFEFALAMIEQLRGGMIRRLQSNEIKRVIVGLFEGMPYLGYSVGAPERFFRGRICNASKLLDKPSEFSYRQPDNVKDYGRCHSPATPIFYCSSNLDAVLSELGPEVGDRIHVGMASAKEKSKLLLTSIGEIDYGRRYRRPVIGNQEAYNILYDELSKIKTQNLERYKRVLVIDAFFSDLFALPARKQHEYRSTSALSTLLFQKIAGLDGFGYPSVEHRGGVNYAILPKSFDEKMEWIEFRVLEVVEYLGFGIYGTKIYATASETDEDEKLIWKKT